MPTAVRAILAVGSCCADGHFCCPDGLLPRRPDADGHRRHIGKYADGLYPTVGVHRPSVYLHLCRRWLSASLGRRGNSIYTYGGRRRRITVGICAGPATSVLTVDCRRQTYADGPNLDR